MRETVGSLRFYFYAVGAIGLVLNAIGLLRGSLPEVLVSLAYVALAIAYLYVGVTLPKLIATPWWIQRLLLVTVVLALVSLAVAVFERQPSVYVSLAAPLLAWYLSGSVHEVAEQEKLKRGTTGGSFA